ncbi:UNVERIFIED_ORG: hypothetical protein M2312_004900 [Rhizobium esperanzae]|nr:hypothetical protein [Rhizobium esperanzae]
MKLPISIMFHEVETPLGFASRLAAANGYPSLEAFLDCTETNAFAISRGDAEAMALLAKWSGEDSAELGRFATRTLDEKLCFGLGDAVFSREHRRGKAHRFCIRCVQNDIRHGEGRTASRPYVRAWWETKAVRTCPFHGSRITEMTCDNGKDDFASFVRSNPHLFGDAGETVGDLRPRELDLYLIDRIRGVEVFPFLDGLETYVVAGLAKYFGRFLHRYRRDDVNENGSFDTLDDAEYGFHAVKLGQAHISDLVSTLLLDGSPALKDEAAPMEPIPRWLRRNLDAPAYATLVELFQDLAERNLPLGEGDTCILPTRKRYRHTVRSASVEYGLMEPRIVELLTKAGLLQAGTATRAKVSFDAELARPILQAAQDTLSLTEAAAILDLSRPRLHEIIDAGLLPRVEADRGDLRAYTRIRRQDLTDFQRRLFKRAQTSVALDGYLSLAKVAHRCNCQLRELVEMVLQDQLEGIVRAGDDLTFPNLFVNLKEAQEMRRRLVKEKIGIKLLTIGGAAAVLKTTQVKVYPLVRSGLLPSISRLNPSTRQRQPFIELEALEAFQRLHISVAEIAMIYGTRADLIAQRMELLGVKPSFDPGSRSGRYYRRRDVDKFTFDPLAA